MRRTFLLGSLALTSLGVTLVASDAPAAPDAATTPVAAPAADPGAGADCVVKGKGVIEKGVFIYSTKEGGTPIAGFATQEVTLELSDLPADPTTGRAKVKTGKGSGSVRIEGWIEATKVPLSARTDIPLAPSHVWIGRGEQLKLKGASPGKLHVETTISATQQKLKAKAACNEVTVGRVKVDDFQIPTGAKKFVLKKTAVELLDEPKGNTVFTLEVPVAEGGVLLYSSENKSGYTRVQHGGSLVIDAWVKTADLKPFPKGEMLDALGAANMVSISPAKLKVEGSTKEVKVNKDVPIRLTANESVKPIGVIEDGAEVIVVDTIADWSRVYPKGLEIIPPDGKDFWVRAKDLQ